MTAKDKRQDKRSKRSGKPQGAQISAAGAPKRTAIEWLVPSAVVLLTLLVFLPVLDNGFLDWDDSANIVTNPNYRGLGWKEIRWMFTTFYMSLYRPLTWVTLAFDYVIWELNPLGYHLSSLIIHGLNTLLFYFISLRLLRSAILDRSTTEEVPLKLGAGLAALAFSLHPLRVEPVAWVSARNDLVSALFILLTVLCYLRAAARANGGATHKYWLSGAWLFYALSILAKASGIGLPFVLLVLDIYPLRRLGGKRNPWLGPNARLLVYEKVPFVVLALAAAVPAVIGKKDADLLFPNPDLTTRIMQAMYGFAFYLWKTIAPTGLSPLYDLPVRLDPFSGPFLLSALAIVTGSIFFALARRRWPALLAAWLCYLLLLAPVSGAVRVGPAIVTDRYSYLSCMGWAVLSGAAFFFLWRVWLSGRIGRLVFVATHCFLIASLIALATLSWKQAQIWHDSERLWQHALSVDPSSGLAHHYLGALQLNRGALNEAVEHLTQAVQHVDPIYSAHAEAYYNYGFALAQSGQLEPAIQQFRRSLELQPNQSAVHFNLANALVQQGNLDQAEKQFQEALRINPEFSKAYVNLGRVLAAQGKIDKAVVSFRKALEVDPNFAAAHERLAQALSEQGKTGEAAVHFQEARRLLKSSPAAIAN